VPLGKLFTLLSPTSMLKSMQQSFHQPPSGHTLNTNAALQMVAFLSILWGLNSICELSSLLAMGILSGKASLRQVLMDDVLDIMLSLSPVARVSGHRAAKGPKTIQT